ncbi:MAG: hypothetical protein ACR2JE_07500 [Acidobacteriaceae bacterium]
MPATIKLNEIGLINKDLVLALNNGEKEAAGYPISEYLHEALFNYDLSYGVHGITTKKALQDGYVGTKYYCYKKMDRDMAKRIVHIHKPKDPKAPQKFYRLTHTAGAPGLRDNSYGNCEEIVGVPEPLNKQP